MEEVVLDDWSQSLSSILLLRHLIAYKIIKKKKKTVKVRVKVSFYSKSAWVFIMLKKKGNSPLFHFTSLLFPTFALLFVEHAGIFMMVPNQNHPEI